jgi:hypothetical protein
MHLPFIWRIEYLSLSSSPIANFTAKAYCPASGSHGDYFSKPSIEYNVEKVSGMVRE